MVGCPDCVKRGLAPVLVFSAVGLAVKAYTFWTVHSRDERLAIIAAVVINHIGVCRPSLDNNPKIEGQRVRYLNGDVAEIGLPQDPGDKVALDKDKGIYLYHVGTSDEPKYAVYQYNSLGEFLDYYIVDGNSNSAVVIMILTAVVGVIAIIAMTFFKPI